MTDWESRARALAADLAAAGQLLDPRWLLAFEQTPRHLFVPRFYRDESSIVDGDDPGSRGEWLAAVYSDESLTTQQAHVPGTNLMWPTSSSTRPSLMARMLDLLQVTDDAQIAEIGTGTGYNAALLCHRLGNTNVASVDIDPTLVSAAGTRLAGLGYHPHLAAGDGAAGIPERAPFDRIIATCAVPAIPTAWIAQLRPDGVIVTDLRGEIASSLLVLRKTSADTVEGQFQTTAGHFMWLRPTAANPLRDGESLTASIDRDEAEQRPTYLDPAVVEHPDVRLMLQLLDPTLGPTWRTRRGDAELLCMFAPDGAWAEVDTDIRAGKHAVTQGGPRHLWDEAERAGRWWEQHGRPSRDRFGLTAHADGTGHVWLDTPAQTWATLGAPAEPRAPSDIRLRRH
jgi:methyltransferase of ATP-grasp peptide maturase system